MAEYICECNVKGIGKKLSQDIVDRFGKRTFDMILKDWKRLMEVEGVGKKKNSDARTSWSASAVSFITSWDFLAGCDGR